MSEKRTWHYVMGLQFPRGGADQALVESSGTVDLRPGMSRHKVFQQIRANMIEGAGEGPDATTVFWMLEPDMLGGAS